MVKRKKVFYCTIPAYADCEDKSDWRRKILQKFTENMKASGMVGYDEPVEITIWAYMRDNMDVDNHLKDIFDALQGWMLNGKKQLPEDQRVIKNDTLIFRTTIERRPPRTGKGVYVEIRPYTRRSWS